MPVPSPLADADRLAILHAWQASGQSAKAFAEAAGVRVWTLYAWRRKLMPESISRRRPAAPPDEVPDVGPDEGPARFAEVVVASRSTAADADRIEILLDEVVIRVPSGSGASDIAAAVHAVRSSGRAAC